jgi:hypothetical protein
MPRPQGQTWAIPGQHLGAPVWCFTNAGMPCNADHIPRIVRPQFRACVANAATRVPARLRMGPERIVSMVAKAARITVTIVM